MVDAHQQSPPSSPVEIPHTNGSEKKEKPAKRSTQNDRSAASRTDIDAAFNKVHELIHDKWPQYQQIVTDFLTGRETRSEFEEHLRPLIEEYKGLVRLHNDVMMSLLANSFRDPPPLNAHSLGWSKSRRANGATGLRSGGKGTGLSSNSGDPHAKRLKAEVMGLSNRERKRVKSIPIPEPSHKLRPNSMIETRFAKLPRVPMSAQKINSSQHHNDIIKGFHAPLCADSHCLPDPEVLKDRILATALENGLLGGIGTQVPELLIHGLELHLRNILTQTISKVRKGSRCVKSVETRRSSVIPKEDQMTLKTTELLFSYDLAPHVYVEPCPSMMRIAATCLDDATPPDRDWSEIMELDKQSLGHVSERVQVAMMLDSFL